MTSAIDIGVWGPRVALAMVAALWLYFVYMTALIFAVAAGGVVGKAIGMMLLLGGVLGSLHAVQRYQLIQRYW